MLKLLAHYPNLHFHWVVFSADGKRRLEASKSAGLFLKSAKAKKVLIKDFRESFFPAEGPLIKELFEELKQRFDPDLIFTHYRHDLHQDHRVVSELTWNTFRNHLILEYEIPKYDGDMGSPNLFVQLDNRIMRQKIRHILDNFKTQRQKHWFTQDTFLSLMRLRGVESGGSRYAEAFYCRKLVLGA
jgi:LmbE family N-acetylglucosaminyl deacetylase